MDLYAFGCRACCIHRWASVVRSQYLLHILLHIDIRVSTERDKISIPQCNGDREMTDVDGQDYKLQLPSVRASSSHATESD